jgi:hypothetical protein
MSSQSSARSNFIKANPGKKRMGKKGRWYRCAHCGCWCGRSGSDKVNIPQAIRMEVDHIKPWSEGGSDELWNLQALCYTCNRSKSADATLKDNLKTIGNTIVHPVDALAGVGRKAYRKSKVLKVLGVNKRK